MRRFTTDLGQDQVLVFAPEVGSDFDYAAFRLYFPSGGFYGLDVESTALSDKGAYDPEWKLRTVQFGTEGYAWVLNVADPVQNAAAASLLADQTNRFTCHTQLDVIAVDLHFGIDITDRIIDTYVLSVMNAPDDLAGGNELKPHVTKLIGPQLAAAEEVMHEKFDELYRRDNPVDAKGRKIGNRAIAKKELARHGFTNISTDDESYLTYGGLDAVAVRRLAPILIKSTRATPTLLSSETWLSQQSMKISRRGHRVDPEALEKLHSETSEEANRLEAEVRDASGLGPRQTVKLVEFFGANGADWSDHPQTDSGAPSLSKDHADLLLSYNLTPDARRAAEAFVSYAGLINRLVITESIRDRIVDGQIHPTLKTVGTVTGRMSSSGPNMQNFAKTDRAMRGLFLPEEGHQFVACDFAQIELRVVAALAGEQAMIDTILSGGDLHQLTADLLGITRQEAKTVNFLIVYGGGGAHLAKKLGFPLDWERSDWISHCYDIVRNYWKQYPAITKYKRWTEGLTEVELISGRKVPVGRLKDGTSKAYANLNYMIQGSARELLVGSWRRFGIDFGRAEMVWMPIHDELVLQVPTELVEAVSKEAEDAMTFNFFGVPIEATPDTLLDEQGQSRWMSGDAAKSIRELAAA